MNHSGKKNGSNWNLTLPKPPTLQEFCMYNSRAYLITARKDYSKQCYTDKISEIRSTCQNYEVRNVETIGNLKYKSKNIKTMTSIIKTGQTIRICVYQKKNFNRVNLKNRWLEWVLSLPEPWSTNLVQGYVFVALYYLFIYSFCSSNSEYSVNHWSSYRIDLYCLQHSYLLYIKTNTFLCICTFGKCRNNRLHSQKIQFKKGVFTTFINGFDD